jgi:hypothetical protein
MVVAAVLSHHISKGLLFDMTAIIFHFPPLIWHVWAVTCMGYVNTVQ